MLNKNRVCRISSYYKTYRGALQKYYLRLYQKNIFLDVKSVAVFFIATIVIHVLWNIWEDKLLFWPLRDTVDYISSILLEQVFNHSVFILDRILPETISYDVETMTIFLKGSGKLKVHPGCSGLKQIIQFSLLILWIKGKFLNKIWFIPAGILTIHVTNLVRIIGLSLVIIYTPFLWDLSHDLLFKILFYVVIFALWIIWDTLLKGNPESKSAYLSSKVV